jgi:hypothetical protein
MNRSARHGLSRHANLNKRFSCFFLAFAIFVVNTGRNFLFEQDDGCPCMRPAVLSISAEQMLAPIRNAILAHAGYGVIPARSLEYALKVLRARHVCAIVVGHSVSGKDLGALRIEAIRLGVSMIVVDPYELGPADRPELHVNPLDGPEVFLKALAMLVARDHQACGSARR